MKKLTPIGDPIRTTSKTNKGREPMKLAGSHVLPNAWNYSGEPRKVKITRCVPFEDKRFLPDKDAVPCFAAYWPGIDPLTGKPWEKR
jgi:hypothetical protein